MLTMCLDHIGWFFLDDPMKLTWIGRIAFPVYAFLLADGFLHICRDQRRWNHHLAVLLILTVVSEPAYDLMDERLNFAHYLNSQSNMITLLLGYAGMGITETFCPSAPATEERRSGLRIPALICTYMLLGFANYMMKGNFNIVGPLLVMAFYWFLRMPDGKRKGIGRVMRRFLILLSIFAVYLLVYFWVRSGFGGPERWWMEVSRYAPWIAGHALAALILSFYNGELGYHQKWFRRVYLTFYPAHAILIGLICILLGR